MWFQAGAEKKAEELSRQLEEERMTSRRTIAKLQRDLARLKSERTHNQVRSRDPCCPPCRTHHPHSR